MQWYVGTEMYAYLMCQALSVFKLFWCALYTASFKHKNDATLLMQLYISVTTLHCNDYIYVQGYESHARMYSDYRISVH